MQRPGRKRTRTLRIDSDQDLQFNNVLQIQFFNQGTAEVNIGDGIGSSTAMLTNLLSRESLGIGNPFFPEDLQRRIEFGDSGSKELIIYVEEFFPENQSLQPERCES